jgi:hypothetical protein
MSRTFEVEQDETVYRKVTWRVEADSFEEAEQMVYDGYAEHWDSDEYDSDYGEVTNVECRDCGETDSDDCECERVDHEFMAEIGL